MSYGSRFENTPAEVSTGFGPVPIGQFVGQFTFVEEKPSGDLEFVLEIDKPAAYQGKLVKFINFYCGSRRKDGTARDAGSVERARRSVAALIRAQGYVDHALEPNLKATHKPIHEFQNVQMFKNRKFLAVIGQEEYVSKEGEIKVKNTLDNFAWWDGKSTPSGPEVPQPEPRRVSNRQQGRYAGTGIENDPGPSDYAGGYAGSLPDDDKAPF